MMSVLTRLPITMEKWEEYSYGKSTLIQGRFCISPVLYQFGLTPYVLSTHIFLIDALHLSK